MTTEFEEHVVETLRGVVPVRSKRMFGGVGVWSDDLFFALIADDVLYLKVDERNRDDYGARGMSAFQPFPGKPSMSYFELPHDVLADKSRLREWVLKSLGAARTKSLRKKPSRPRANAKGKIPHIGPASTRSLAAIGVRTLADLEKKGSVATFRALAKRGFRPTANLLFALEGALLGLRRERLPEVVKENLKRRAGLR